jgi:uncharacterized protein (DUF1810 family)
LRFLLNSNCRQQLRLEETSLNVAQAACGVKKKWRVASKYALTFATTWHDRGNVMADTERTMNDPYDLQRFVDAQSGSFERACDELQKGRKQSHWMWFIFPQLRGLGHSPMASKYGISSLQEATAYLRHPILGPRLRYCTELVIKIEGRSAEHIFGVPDDLKFRSCVTLFARADSENQIFKDALQKYFAGEPDQMTLDRL